MSKELIDLYNTLYLRGFIRDIDGVNSTILKNAIKEIDRLQNELYRKNELILDLKEKLNNIQFEVETAWRKIEKVENNDE